MPFQISGNVLLKDPDATLDYTFDWSQWLGDSEDTIAVSTWTVPDGLTQPKAASHTDTQTTVWLAGGVAGNGYQVRNLIITAQGRTDEWLMVILVKEKSVGDELVAPHLIPKLRRMVAEPTLDVYSNEALTETIMQFPLVDQLGTSPLIINATTTPPTVSYQPTWISTWDLNATAAEIWAEKGAEAAAQYSFNADGASFSRSDYYQHCMQQVRYYRSRRSAKSVSLNARKRVSLNESFIVNKVTGD